MQLFDLKRGNIKNKGFCSIESADLWEQFASILDELESKAKTTYPASPSVDANGLGHVK